jgi:hypothetical protein
MLHSSFDDEYKKNKIYKKNKYDPEKIKSSRSSRKSSVATENLGTGSSGGTTPIGLTRVMSKESSD